MPMVETTIDVMLKIIPMQIIGIIMQRTMSMLLLGSFSESEHQVISLLMLMPIQMLIMLSGDLLIQFNLLKTNVALYLWIYNKVVHIVDNKKLFYSKEFRKEKSML